MDIFSLLIIFFPLLPAVAILLTHTYRKESLNFLMILCLLNFTSGVILHAPGTPATTQQAVSNTFSLFELLILAKIFLPLLPAGIKSLLVICFVAFISSLATSYLLKGLSQKNSTLEIMQEGIIVLFTVYGLSILILAGNMNIFRLPLFWIATGTLFYFSIAVLTNVMGQSINEDGRALLYIAGLLRYVFYLFAALFYDEDIINNR